MEINFQSTKLLCSQPLIELIELIEIINPISKTEPAICIMVGKEGNIFLPYKSAVVIPTALSSSLQGLMTVTQ